MADLANTDFSMKPQVDITAIANVLQRKRQMEIDAQQQRRQQNLQELGQAIQLGTQLTSTLVQQSKDKQKAQFVQNLGESLASTVPTAMSPQMGPTLPVMNPMGDVSQRSSLFPNANGQAYQQDAGAPLPPLQTHNLPKENLMRSAAFVNPEEASKAAFKLANPGLNDTHPMQFQRMTLQGSDGKPRQVSVGMLGNQMVNPFTKEPIDMNNKAQVDALPEYGFVQREEVAGSDNNGNTVYRNPVQHTAYTKDAQGQAIPYNGKIMPKLENPGEATQKNIAFIAETRSNLRDAMDRFDPSYVGLINQRYKTIGEYMADTTDPKAAEFRNFIEEINSTRRHELYAGNLTEGEQKVFKDIALNRNISPEAFMARIRALERKLDNKERAMYKSAKQSGVIIRSDNSPSSGGSIDLGDGFSIEE